LAYIFLPRRNSPRRPGPPHYQALTITLRHTTISMTPLVEGSARRRDRTLKTSKRASAEPRLGPPGYWDKHLALSNEK